MQHSVILHLEAVTPYHKVFFPRLEPEGPTPLQVGLKNRKLIFGFIVEVKALLTGEASKIATALLFTIVRHFSMSIDKSFWSAAVYSQWTQL